MSLFLGHIHYLMYNKILFGEEIFDNLLSLIEDDKVNEYRDDLNSDFLIERGNLEDIIDETNIHGWLDERVKRSENKIAKIVSILLDEGKDLEEIKSVYYNLGKEAENVMTPVDAFNIITNKFLDGMPCDGAIIPIENTEDRFTFKVNNDVHKEIWSKYVSPDIYWTLRNEFVRGILDNSEFNLKEKGDTYTIER